MDLKKKCGILLHPTSLPSPHGIGDLGDGGYNFIDFLNKAKQSLWQILPLSPTTFGDSPYQSFSAFAGNFLLISLDRLVDNNLISNTDIPEPNFETDRVDYKKVIDYKLPAFKEGIFKLCS